MADRAPVRAVHLGLGAFHRSHQAWYTELANQVADTEPYGIWSFTGRRPDLAQALTAQDCRYALIERSAAGDQATMIDSIVRASDGADGATWRAALSDPQVAVLTMTVTEVGYRVPGEDRERLRAGEHPSSAPARIIAGLAARRAADAGPLAVISCDNLADNGQVTKNVLLDLARDLDPALVDWIGESVSFVSTMVDRITPATTPEDVAIAERLTGRKDSCPVVAEPFSEWVLAGDFPAGRPGWEAGGARFVADVAPYEQRKLWLLNGSHSMLAYVGLFRGLSSVDEAMHDSVCTELMEELWDEAAVVLPFAAAEIDQARAALRERFGNPRIRHQLTQIAMDGSLKLPLRILNVYRARRSRGLPMGRAAAVALAAWIEHLKGDQVNDRGASELIMKLHGAGSDYDQVRATLATLDSGSAGGDLVGDDDLVRSIVEAREWLIGAGGASHVD